MTLEKEIFNKKVGEMKEGDSGYIAPWIFVFDEEGSVYLSLDARIAYIPYSKWNILIKKTGASKSEYDISLNPDTCDEEIFDKQKHNIHFLDGLVLKGSLVKLVPEYNIDTLVTSAKISKLEREMKEAVEGENYEYAAELRDQIKELNKSNN